MFVVIDVVVEFVVDVAVIQKVITSSVESVYVQQSILCRGYLTPN